MTNVMTAISLMVINDKQTVIYTYKVVDANGMNYRSNVKGNFTVADDDTETLASINQLIAKTLTYLPIV